MFRMPVCAVVLGAAISSVAPAAEDLKLDLVLRGAVFGGERPGESDPALLIDVGREGDQWSRAWGIARSFNVAHHVGRVESAEVTGETVKLSLAMLIHGDAWVKGGRAQYDISLKRGEGGALTGEFTGVFRGEAVRGVAYGSISAQREAVVEGVQPVQPGEHPRILFRKHELPALRQRAQTPLGKAALAKMEDGGPVGLGVKHQLTGDEAYAERAIPLVEELIAKGLYTNQFGVNVGDRAQQVAIAYDCCYDVWPADVKRKVEVYLAWATTVIFFAQDQMSRGINWHVCSNWSAPVYTGAGFAGLALWGEKGPPPVEPMRPAAVAEIPPVQESAIGEGAPVVDFTAGFFPNEWLMTTPLDFAVSGDLLAEIGGMETVKINASEKFAISGKAVSFEPLASDLLLTVGRGGVAINQLMKDRSALTICLHTVFRVKTPQVVQVNLPFGRAGKPQMAIAGERVRHEQLVELKEGMYPVTVVLSLASKWESYTPTLDKAGKEEIAAAKAQLPTALAEYEEARRDWEQDLAQWKQLGGANVQYMKLFEMGRRMMLLHYREGVGTGGFQAEVGGYSAIATASAAMYAPAYRKMFGRDCSPYADISLYVPRKMFAHVYGPNGEMYAQDINGTPKISPGVFGILFPVVPDEWKPAVLWGWHRHAGVEGVGDAESAERLLSYHAGHSHWNWIYSFLHYPLDMKPQRPQGILPLTWEAPDFGYFGFRNAWQGKDDFIAQVFLKAHRIGGWNGPNAGTFRLLGLGHVWAYGPSDRNRSRWEENVVQLPENPEINVGACGNLTHIETSAGGSGVVSMGLSDVYATASTDRKGRKPRLYEAYGNIRVDSAFKDSGITGMRSIGVDYSGKCGAPCLFVVVDNISGGKDKVWTWAVDSSEAKRKKGEPTNLDLTTVADNTFTIMHEDGATLKGTFITPEYVRVTKELRKTTMTGGGGSSAGKTLDRPVYGVFAEGGDHYFCVVTIGKGDAPEVTAEGKGLAAKVTVGKQTIRFDGEKIVFGK